MLNWINLDETLTLLVLICLLVFTGWQMARPDTLAYRHACKSAAATLLLYGVLAVSAWGLSSAGDLLAIVVRAMLAAGIVFGLSSIILAAVYHTVGDPVQAVAGKFREWKAECERRVAQNEARREAAERARREREEQARLAPLLEEERRRQAEEAAQYRQHCDVRIDEARAEVIGFYDGHSELLAEALPPSLFRSQIETRFPESVTPEDAWQAAQDMLAEMLPLIAEAREKQRTEQQKQEEEAAEEERRQREPAQRREAIHRLTEWYEQEKVAIEQRLPEGPERDVILHELHDRYDQLMKEALRELTP